MNLFGSIAWKLDDDEAAFHRELVDLVDELALGNAEYDTLSAEAERLLAKGSGRDPDDSGRAT